MSKVSALLSNIFARRQSSLEVDAVPVSNDRRQNHNNDRTINSFPNENDESLMNNNFETVPSIDYTNSSDESLALATTTSTAISDDNLTNFSNSSNLNELSPLISTPNTNNSLAINNTQGHIVYQFSNIDGLHIGHVINVQSDNKKTASTNQSSTTRKQQNKPRTRTIQKMMESKEELDRKMIDTISTHLGEGWKDIMRTLNYSEGQIHQAIIDYNIEGLKEVIFQLILEWSRNEENANLGEITKILWKAGHRDIVYYMKNSWKEQNDSNESEI